MRLSISLTKAGDDMTALSHVALSDAIPPTRPTRRETLLLDGLDGRFFQAKVNHQVRYQVTSRLPVPLSGVTLSVCCVF